MSTASEITSETPSGRVSSTDILGIGFLIFVSVGLILFLVLVNLAYKRLQSRDDASLGAAWFAGTYASRWFVRTGDASDDPRVEVALRSERE